MQRSLLTEKAPPPAPSLVDSGEENRKGSSVPSSLAQTINSISSATVSASRASGFRAPPRPIARPAVEKAQAKTAAQTPSPPLAPASSPRSPNGGSSTPLQAPRRRPTYQPTGTPTSMARSPPPVAHPSDDDGSGLEGTARPPAAHASGTATMPVVTAVPDTNDPEELRAVAERLLRQYERERALTRAFRRKVAHQQQQQVHQQRQSCSGCETPTLTAHAVALTASAVPNAPTASPPLTPSFGHGPRSSSMLSLPSPRTPHENSISSGVGIGISGVGMGTGGDERQSRLKSAIEQRRRTATTSASSSSASATSDMPADITATLFNLAATNEELREALRRVCAHATTLQCPASISNSNNILDGHPWGAPSPLSASDHGGGGAESAHLSQPRADRVDGDSTSGGGGGGSSSGGGGGMLPHPFSRCDEGVVQTCLLSPESSAQRGGGGGRLSGSTSVRSSLVSPRTGGPPSDVAVATPHKPEGGEVATASADSSTTSSNGLPMHHHINKINAVNTATSTAPSMAVRSAGRSRGAVTPVGLGDDEEARLVRRQLQQLADQGSDDDYDNGSSAFSGGGNGTATAGDGLRLFSDAEDVRRREAEEREALRRWRSEATRSRADSSVHN